MTAHKVSELGESALVERITARLGKGPPQELWGGDDTAVVQAPGTKLLFTADTMVQGIDFDLAYADGSDIGWKSLIASISDIAAMGGQPSHALVSFAMSPATEVGFVDGVVDGLLEARSRYGCDIVGGDLSGANEMVITTAVLGSAPGPVVGRSGAAPGDVICVTGALGGSAAGLRLLQAGAARSGLAERFVKRHLRPHARIEEGRKLAQMGASSMMDISDGLVIDLSRLLDAGGLGCSVDPGSIPVEPGLESLSDLIAGADPFDMAVLGGEDLELLFTMPPRSMIEAEAEMALFEAPVTPIGTVTERGEARMLGDSHLDRWKEASWDHLRNR